MKVVSDGSKPTPGAELRSLIGKFDSKHQKLFRSVRTALRKRVPTANELAYGYPSSVVVGYSPTDKGIEAVLAIAARADGLALLHQWTEVARSEGTPAGIGKADPLHRGGIRHAVGASRREGADCRRD